MIPTLRTLRHAVLILLAILVLSGIYMIVSPHGNGPATTGPAPAEAGLPASLAAFITHAEPKPVADLAFSDESGATRKLSDWKGRVVLLNLWATWCAPCRAEIPELAHLQAELGSADFEVIALSLDREGTAAAARFFAETGSRGLGLYADPTTRSLSDVKGYGLPTTLLIGRDGREIGRILGPAPWGGPEAKALITKALSRE